MASIHKKGLKFWISIVCLGCAVFLSDGKAVAGERVIYHVVTTVCENSSNAVTVNYHCANPSSYVLYTKASDKLFGDAEKVEPACTLWSTRGIEKTAKETSFYTQERYVCIAELSGLEPDTKYIYKIVSEGFESMVYSFVTAGKRGKWNFVAFTDFQHRRNSETLPLIKSMKEIAHPALVICSGDMVDVAGKEDGWDWILDNDIFCDFVYAASPGDHEYWADDSGRKYPQYDKAHTFNHLFKFPGNGAPMSMNTTYWFRYNNVLFVALDMDNSNVATGPRFEDQVKWFEKTLDSLKGTYQYLVVYEHKSIYGSSKIDAVVAARLRPQWAPVFKKYGVDLVLSGHDHIYSRTSQIDGTYYLDMGSSGDKRRALDESVAQGDGIHEKVLDLKGDALCCGSNIKVSSRKMKITVYNQYKQVVDSFTIKAKRKSSQRDNRREQPFYPSTFVGGGAGINF